MVKLLALSLWKTLYLTAGSIISPETMTPKTNNTHQLWQISERSTENGDNAVGCSRTITAKWITWVDNNSRVSERSFVVHPRGCLHVCHLLSFEGSHTSDFPLLVSQTARVSARIYAETVGHADRVRPVLHIYLHYRPRYNRE